MNDAIELVGDEAVTIPEHWSGPGFGQSVVMPVPSMSIRRRCM